MSIKEQIHDLSDEMLADWLRLIPSLECLERENRLGKDRQRH